jgi:glycosyltransferase involved in cell wall biosynthesis
MRIAIISTPFVRCPPIGYGGTELFCYEMAEELTHRRHDVTVYTTGDSVLSCRRRALYHQPVWPPTPADELNHVAWALAEIGRDGGYDLVHMNCPFGLPVTRFIQVPVVHTIHHSREEPVSRVYAVHSEVHYVAISARQRALEVPLQHSTVIHHGLSASRYRPSLADQGYLAHLGRFAPEKGTHIAIDVARDAGLPIRLAGRTHAQDLAYYEKEIAPRIGTPGVHLLGEADFDQKLAMLRGARALLCPLQWEEPFGLAAIEAMLCGTPVIGFGRGSFPEIIDEGVTGFLVEDAAAMTRIAGALERFDRAACARRARERFSTETMVTAYEELYRTVVRSRSNARVRAA